MAEPSAYDLLEALETQYVAMRRLLDEQATDMSYGTRQRYREQLRGRLESIQSARALMRMTPFEG